MALGKLRRRLAERLVSWSWRLASQAAGSDTRRDLRILLFFHGYSLAHTLRPLVIGRSLRARGYGVEFAGVGPHACRIAEEGFPVHAVTTMPQSHMDEYVSRGDYAYYDLEWIDRCVRAERELLGHVQPHLVVGDMRPTLACCAALEGVDMATVEAGYNAPGYPYRIRLPEWFPTSPGPFEEYLESHSSERRAHRRILLVADVPEFHLSGEVPWAGARYVGPLLDLPTRPRRIPVLEEGWDEAVPLICVNCGSTGGNSDFMGPLLAALGRGGFRVLATTSGRWSGSELPSNVRVTEFLPAHWIMPAATALVGIGGIGSIYHALREGVPVIGAPEHLDQEYHLNRVRALGLGLKLEWDELADGERVLAAVKSVCEDAGYRSRCRDFARYARRWDGGEAAADAVDGLLLPPRHEELGGDDLVGETDFLRHLELSTPPSLAAEDLAKILEQGRSMGLPHTRSDDQTWYGRRDSWNWLYDNDRQFFESDYLSLEERRSSFFVSRDGGVDAQRPCEQVRLTYRLQVHCEEGSEPRQALVFLPYPLVGEHQPEVRLEACEPAELRDWLVASAGLFYGYPVALGAGSSGTLELAYTCTVQVVARTGDGTLTSPPLSPAERERYTEVDDRIRKASHVRDFLERVGSDHGGGPYETVRGIYNELASTKRFGKTKEQCQCPACSTRVVLSQDRAHCLTLSRAFITLCRVQGVPAREVAGALLGYPTGDECYEIGFPNEPLFGHTWVEIHTEEHGWLPVEFHGIVIGETALTAGNAGPEVQELARRNGGSYQDYYFGNLDCHRVVCSNSVKEIPQILMKEAAGDRMPEWTVPPDLKWECHLRAERI